MEFKTTSNKSQSVKALKKIFPHGWANTPDSNEPDAVLFDALQGLIGFKDGTGRECANRTSYAAQKFINEYCGLVVFCFDQHDDVPITKAAEQALRAKSVIKTREAKDAVEPSPGPGYRELPSPGIWLDRPVPHDFAEGLQDRAGYRREVIRFICRQWICSSDPKVRLHPRAGCKVVISGHCLTKEDLLEITEPDDWDALGLGDSYDPEHIPIVVEGDTFHFEPDLRHRLGEGEMQFFHFLEQLRPERPLLISTDTDVLFLALVYLRRHPDRKCRIDWRYDSRKPENLFCHVNDLVEAILKGRIELSALVRKRRKNADFPNVAKRWEEQEDPVLQLAAAQALAGTDYTQGMLMLTHETVLKTLLCIGGKIGPLVLNSNPNSPDLSPEAYMRMLTASWIHARMPELEVAPPLVMMNASGGKSSSSSSASRPEKNLDPRRIRDAWREHLLKAWNGSQRFEKRYRLPHPVKESAHFTNRILRWVYYMHMQFQVGNASLVLGDPQKWGYGPTDEPITRENIYPILDESA